MQLLQSHAGQGVQSMLGQTRAMLQVQLHMVDDGLLNHEMFRAAVHNGFHYGQTQTPPASGPSATSAAQQEQNGPATPQLSGPGNGNGNGNGLGPSPEPGKPNERVTPTPKNNGNGSNNGNNTGGNDKNKDPKDQDPDKNGASDNGKGNRPGGKNK